MPTYQRPKISGEARGYERAFGTMYDMAFENYKNGEYERVIEAADSALTLSKKMRSCPLLLKIMAIGATEKLIVYRKALEDYIAKYTAARKARRGAVALR